MADTIYSLLLGAAMFSLVLGSLVLIGARVSDRVTARAAFGLAILSLTLALLSAGVHLAWDHAPGSPGALPLPELLAEHPASLLVPGAAALLALFARRLAV